jgi:hypothetical protein
MLDWRRRFGLRSRAQPAREDLLNEGLALAMDWGESWLAPIQARLAQQHPRLQRVELDELNAVCQTALRFGHETVHDMVRRSGKEVTQADFSAAFLAANPWASPDNVMRLFNQGLYYAWKTGGPADHVL